MLAFNYYIWLYTHYILLIRFKLFTLCILLAVISFAQQAKQYVFTHFSTGNGLTSNIVHGIVQDHRGYMWMNTLNGLQRYDGNKFITFHHKPSDSTTIPSDDIFTLYEDSKANLWVRTAINIGIFNKHTFKYEDKMIYGNTKEEPYIILFIGEDANGDALIYVDKKGIFKYDQRKDQFLPVTLFRLPREWNIIDIKMTTDKQQMIFATAPGFVVYNFKTGNVNLEGHIQDSVPLLKNLADEKPVIRIFEANKDDIWYSTWPLVGGAPFFQYKNFKTGETKKLSLYDEFPGQGYYENNGLLRQKSGKLWFFGKPFIVEYSQGKKPFQKISNEYKDEQSIKFDEIFLMYEDRQQNVWVCTNNGLFLFNPQAQSFFSYSLIRPDGTGAKDGPAQAAVHLKNGDVLVGGWGTGLYAYDEKFTPVPLPSSLKKYVEPYSIWDIKQATDGLVWIGMQNGGLIVYDPAINKADLIEDSAFRARTIRQVDEDEYGNMWFGNQSGNVVRWNKKIAGGKVNKGYEIIKKNDTSYINKIYADKHGYVWAGSEGRGLFKYNTATGKLEDHITTRCPPNHRLWKNFVYDVLRYNDSIILIACGSLDVLNTRTNEITHITTEDGLPSNTVYSVQQDKNGTIWMGLAYGLCRMNLEKKIFFIYDRRDGITYDNFNPAGVVKMLDGRFIYPTDHNIVVFDPSGIADPPKPPDPVITGFKLGNESLLADSITALKKLELAFDNTSFIVEFSSLNYTGQNKIHYHYKLDGLDKDWNESTDLNQATYNYLHPGNYTFRVRAENSNGVPSKETILQITVVPPFYATWWFYGLIILAAIAVIYWVDKERIKRLQTLQRMRTQIAGNLHEEINTTLNNISLLSEMAKIKAGKDVERSKEYIEQISDKSKRMIDAMDDMLWSIQPENDRMEKTLLRMQEFAEGLQNEYNTGIVMMVDENIKSLKLDMKLRHELFLIFKQALKSVIESASQAQTIINIDLSNSKLLLKIRAEEPSIADSGLNYFAASINEMNKRAALINAELDVQHDKKGISVILLMPVH